MLGDDYISQHLLNEYQKEQREKTYRTYITDALYGATHGQALTIRWADLDKPQEPEQDAQEIIDDLMQKINRR